MTGCETPKVTGWEGLKVIGWTEVEVTGSVKVEVTHWAEWEASCDPPNTKEDTTLQKHR